MTREELVAIVSRNNSETLIASKLRAALGIERPKRRKGNVRDKSAKARRYKGARKLMRQRYGVKL